MPHLERESRERYHLIQRNIRGDRTHSWSYGTEPCVLFGCKRVPYARTLDRIPKRWSGSGRLLREMTSAGRCTAERLKGRRFHWLLVLVGALVAAHVSTRGIAQTGVAGVAADPSVQRALEFARSTEQDTIRDQIRLCEIPAPPFGEAARAAAYAASMRAAGLKNVRTDSVGNVLGERPGRNRRPHLVLSAHLDTVFPAEVPVSVTRDK